MQIHFRKHDPGTGEFRVWRSDWPGDTFEIIDAKMMLVFQSFCERFGIPLIDEDLEGGD